MMPGHDGKRRPSDAAGSEVGAHGRDRRRAGLDDRRRRVRGGRARRARPPGTRSARRPASSRGRWPTATPPHRPRWPRCTPRRAALTSTAASASATFWGFLAGLGVRRRQDSPAAPPWRSTVRRTTRRRRSARPLAVAAVVALPPSTTSASARPSALTRVIVGLRARRARASSSPATLARRHRRSADFGRLDAGRRARRPARPPACCSSPSPATRASRPSARRSWTPRRTIPRAIPAPSASPSSSTRPSPSARSPPSAPTRWPRLRAPLAAAVHAGRPRLARRRSCGSARAIASLGVLLSLHRRRQPNHVRDGGRPATAPLAGRGPPEAPGSPPRRVVGGGLRRRAGAVIDVGGAIGFSSFAVLTYYAITNAAALTLPRRRTPLAPRNRRARSGRMRSGGGQLAG